jgi:hypothetical protein
MTIEQKSVPSVSVSYARNGSSTKANAFGMRPMQERAYEKRGEQYLLIKSPPASGKSRALMFVALDKLQNPDGHFKIPHLWPPKLLQAGRANYRCFEGFMSG